MCLAFRGVTCPTLPPPNPPPPVSDQAEKPEDQQSPETIENTGESAELY